jgi:hypothetical protein
MPTAVQKFIIRPVILLFRCIEISEKGRAKRRINTIESRDNVILTGSRFRIKPETASP